MSKLASHKCGATFPNSSRHGHCSGCCRTFVGLAAFDAHRVGKHGVDRRCEILPEEYVNAKGRTVTGHWQDDKGYWHVGPRDPRFA